MTFAEFLTLIGTFGGGAGLSQVVNALRRPTDKPVDPARDRTSSIAPPAPMTRAEFDALAYRVAQNEDAVRRNETAIAALDRRLDEEVVARMTGQQETIREISLTKSGLERIVGFVEGIRNGQGPLSRGGR